MDFSILTSVFAGHPSLEQERTEITRLGGCLLWMPFESVAGSHPELVGGTGACRTQGVPFVPCRGRKNASTSQNVPVSNHIFNSEHVFNICWPLMLQFEAASADPVMRAKCLGAVE